MCERDKEFNVRGEGMEKNKRRENRSLYITNPLPHKQHPEP
jgi:hypothetical protein